MNYSVVIATMDRSADLAEALESLSRQTLLPSRVVIIDNSTDEQTRELAEERRPFDLRYERAERPGAAHQRNQGIRHVGTSLLAFMDDDVVLEEGTFSHLLKPFQDDAKERVGGVSARFRGEAHPVPGGLKRFYYKLQAGYDDRTYGGRLFGAALVAYPCYLPEDPEYIPADWLPSTCVLYRTSCCRTHRFPGFEGYSAMEDVYLSASIARRHRLFFSREAYCLHKDSPNRLKRDRYTMARQRNRNRATICREVMGVPDASIFWKLLLHRAFDTAEIIRQHRPGWLSELRGTWSFAADHSHEPATAVR